MTQRTGDGARSDYIERMGLELGTQFYALWQELIWLHMKWSEYDVLYGSGSKRVDLLNEAAPAFFWMLEHVLWEDMLLHIARLADPPTSCGKENLTIQNLPEFISDPEAKANVEKLVQTALTKTKFARDWRNRQIAHNDLALAIDKERADPLSPANREQVHEALSGIQNVFMEMERRYMCPDTVFIGSITPRGAFDLLGVLHFGIKEQNRANERIRAGRATEDDYPALFLRD